MNWGKVIVLTFVLFAAFIGFMVFWMHREQVDLVRDDYYQTEIVYQKQIDRMTNARHEKPMGMTYQARTHRLAVVIPTTLRKGEIHFYRPADRQLDFVVHISTAHPSQQVVSTAKLARGYWKVQFTWSDGQHGYYTEEDIFL